MSKVVTNKMQMTRMVELLEQDLHLARNELIKSVSDKKWQEIASELNKLGPPDRDAIKWQRVWTDLKYKTKKKVDENKNAIYLINYPKNLHTFTSLEDRIMKIMNLNYSYNDEMTTDTVITPTAGPSKFSYNDEMTTSTASSSNLLDEKINESDVLNTNENITGRRPQLPKEQLEFYANVSSELKNFTKEVEKIQDDFRKQTNLQETALQLKKQKFEYLKEYQLKKENK